MRTEGMAFTAEAKAALDELKAVGSEFGMSQMLGSLARVEAFAGQNQFLDVAVLGQFKAGKSSFLNAFIGEPLLPTGSIPTTSVITRVSGGSRRAARVTFSDGREQAIAVDEVNEYVAEANNPENIKNVLFVDITTPLLSGLAGLRLVDTPGIGSVWRHNTETTAGWFPETGGALFVISAEKPVSEAEILLLQEVYRYTPAIAVIITKTDLFGQSEVDEIERFTREAIKRTFGLNFPVFRYSARANTGEFNAELARSFFLPLAQKREENYERILKHKLSSLASSSLSYLNVAYQASLKAEAEKEKLKESIIDENLNLTYVRRELQLIASSYKGKTREKIAGYLEVFRPQVEEVLSRGYEEAFPTWKGNLSRVTAAFENWLKESLYTNFMEILLDEEVSFDILSSVKNHLAHYLKSFRGRLNENLKQALGVEMRSENWEIALPEIKGPSISVSRTFDSHLDMLWFLFPMFIYRGLFKRYFFKQIAYEVDKNLHRLTSNLTEKVNREIDGLMTQALKYIGDELALIETLLSETEGRSEHIEKRIKDVESLLTSLTA